MDSWSLVAEYIFASMLEAEFDKTAKDGAFWAVRSRRRELEDELLGSISPDSIDAGRANLKRIIAENNGFFDWL